MNDNRTIPSYDGELLFLKNIREVDDLPGIRQGFNSIVICRGGRIVVEVGGNNLVKVKPGKMAKPKLKNERTRKVKVSWKKMTGADKYQIRYRVKGAAKWKTRKVAAKSANVMLKKLKQGKTYQVEVRAYDKQTKAWGAWSKACKVTVKK